MLKKFIKSFPNNFKQDLINANSYAILYERRRLGLQKS